MTEFARSPARAGAPPRALAGRSILIAALACFVALIAAAPSFAKVTAVGETTVGLQPRNDGLKKEGPTPRPFGEGSKASFGNEAGHAVVHGASVYSIYWDPNDLFHEHQEWLVKTDHFLQQMGASSGDLRTIFSSVAQYRDRSNAPASDSIVFKGSYHDFVKYPVAGCTDPKPLELGAITCLTDAQLREQLSGFVASHGLPKGMNTIYYLITPPGVTVCLDAAGGHCSDFAVSEEEAEEGERKSESWENSFCSYHGGINPSKAAEGDGNTLLYAAIPWTAGAEGSAAFTSGTSFYDNAFDCQDGGFMVENEEVVREVAKAPEKGEEEVLKGEKGTPKEKFELERRRRLENPHIQEPNQEGKGEFGDYSAGLADVTINQIALEHANIVTDPLLQSWKAGGGEEVTDLCRNVFANTVGGPVQGSGIADVKTEAGAQSNESVGDGRYYVNNVWSHSDHHCVGGVGFIPRFTAPSPVNAGEIVGFNGMGSTVSLIEAAAFGPSGPPTTTYATFAWDFGDGTQATGYAPGSPACEAPWLSPCAGSVFHSYAYGGSYDVSLTITDVAGNKTSHTETITVAGPAAPSAAGSAGSPGASSPGGSSPGSSPAGSGKGAAVPPGKPVAAATVMSRSLKRALRTGLAVSYSVNEQVAGHFDALLARSLARKLKIGGAPATGLPAGTPPQLVIAKAILVTTKGGHSVVHIKFSKKVAARLAHAHKAPLMLRLVVRNAASSNPQVTSVLSSITLTG